MNLNQPSLVQFETERRANNFSPPLGSNSFYDIGTDGRINLYVIRENPALFDLLTDKGTVAIGAGGFTIAGDTKSGEFAYNSLTVIAGTKLVNNHVLTISNSKMEIYGTFDNLAYSMMSLRSNATVIFYPDSVFDITKDSKINIDSGSTITIYGTINIDLDMVETFLSTPGIIIDSAAVMNVKGLSALGDRLFSMTDYYTELSNRVININTQGEKNFATGRIGYNWTGGTPLNQSQWIKMIALWGESVLGDFKLSILGKPANDIHNFQIVSDLVINENSTLYITEKYRDYEYMHPELYLGIIIGNNEVPGDCTIHGTLIVNGANSKISLDRGATIHISETGELYLKNSAQLISTYNTDKEVLFIDGKLIIDDISQINTLQKANIVFGDNGKVIILNPDTGERRVLFSTPNGIESSDLYRLFKDTIDHIEYHVSNNTGIIIDQYYEFYARDFTTWFGNRRIEKAIFDGILVWHDGGFIQLSSKVIPWVTTECTLYHASRLFKTFGSYDAEKLQEATDHLKYAGCGNIVFIFEHESQTKEVTLILDDIHMTNIFNTPMTNMYLLSTDKDGELFIRNNVAQANPTEIISNQSKVVPIVDKKAEFTIS